MQKLWILIGIFFLLLISGCDYINLPTKEDFISTPKCREWVMSKIQTEYELFESTNKDSWFDKDNTDHYFSKGRKRGENINYFYYRGKGFFSVEETVVDEDGTILGIRKAVYAPVLEPIPRTEETYQTIVGLKRQKQKFEVIDIQLSSCVLEK